MKELNFIIADRLSSLRKANKLTQLELAEKLNYSDKAISKWENGESVPSVEVLYKLSRLYEVSMDYLVGENPRHSEKPAPAVHKRRRNITLLSVVAVWLVAIIFYISFDIFANIKLWIHFCWAVPLSLITALIFDIVWNKRRFMFWFISFIIWSMLVCLSLQFFSYNIWQILLIGVPLQIATILWAKMVN